MPDQPKSLFHQELERRANDLIKVFNPTDKDYIVEWSRRDGSKLFRVPAKGDAILIRYIAEKYLQEMFEKLMVDKTNAAVLAIIDIKSVRRAKKLISSGTANWTNHFFHSRLNKILQGARIPSEII